MSLKILKTGLADIMRGWMSARAGNKIQRRFTMNQICEYLQVKPGDERQKVHCALGDFIRRKEVIVYYIKGTGRRSGMRRTRQFLYVHDWQKALKGSINRKVYKAMYVSQTFAVTDLCRLTGLKERNYFDKIIRRLKNDGLITQVQRRSCAHGAGAENVYHITNRDRFKLEMMR